MRYQRPRLRALGIGTTPQATQVGTRWATSRMTKARREMGCRALATQQVVTERRTFHRQNRLFVTRSTIARQRRQLRVNVACGTSETHVS